jgi:hypothetical protein
MKAIGILLGGFLLVLGLAAPAQLARVGNAAGFTLPDYYPSTNGVQKLRTVLTGSQAQPLSNGVFLLTDPRIENYTQDGELEWVATSLDAVASIFTHSAWSTNHLVFKTADTNLVLKARGFLWRQAEGVLIVSNQTTWIDRALFTNSSILP